MKAEIIGHISFDISHFSFVLRGVVSLLNSSLEDCQLTSVTNGK